jgi:sister-chromatid-cohesion protein PDS5
LEYTSKILINFPDMKKQIEPFLKSKFIDPDEKVRMNAIRAAGVVIRDHPDLFSQETLLEIGLRTKDKKSGPRFGAIEVLSKQFKLIMKHASENPDIDVNQYAWIPGTIVEVAYLDDSETT